MNAAARRWIPALAPGLVLVLIAAQILLGMGGFDHPHGGLLGALELPGRLLGWGGVALLVPLFGWLLLGMWGYSVTGMALKMLGSVTLALSVGGLAALAGGEAAGGRIGGPLADLLSQSLGSVVAAIVLLIMAAPGVLLASARFQLGPSTRRSPPTLAAPSLAPPPRDEPPSDSAPAPKASPAARARGWYPERRFDEKGNELPMQFGNAKDVGGIRYRDEEPRAQATEPARGTPAAPPAPEPAPEVAGAAAPPADARAWPKGLVHAEGDDEVPAPEDDLERTRAAVPNAAERLRPAPARPPSREERARTQPAPEEAAPEAPKRVFARSLFPKNPGDPVLIPGVRYRDEPDPPPAAPAPPPPAPAPVAPPPPPPAPRREAAPTSALPARREATARASSKAAPPAPKPPEPDLFPEPEQPPPEPEAPRRRAKTAPAAAPDPAQAPAPAAPAPRQPSPPAASDDAVPFGARADNSRYQSQLAASGIFDVPPAPAAPAQRPPARAPAPEPEAASDEPPPPEPPARKAGKRAPKTAPTPEPAQPPKGPPAPPVPAAPKGAWVEELGDPVFVKAIEASLERGAASAVLLTRRLGLGYGKAQALIERMAKTGVLGEVSPTGARPVLISREDLDGARGP